MSGPVHATAARAANHVLRATPVALDRLRRHAGRSVSFALGPVDLAFTVQTTGELVPALPGASRDLEVRVSPFLLPRLAAGDEAAFRDIDMRGDMELAQEISFLLRNLRWDAEEDLARVVGDVAAHRIAGFARAFASGTREAGLRTAQAAAEYWTEESPVIASRVKVQGFVEDVARLREDLERLEKRIARLGPHAP
ncbi:MAG TPA: SCP2 sterol-binding domain-containing protein [Usitatibacter sp.]|jgi:ubiquinone biosynthesis protein UbiJ|nr:SCP2 sterol-binding domain-containing protein [Usitatibacter sp.]